MNTENSKVPVAERAIFTRLNRRLFKDGKVLKRCRADSRWHSDLGDFYEVDRATNSVTSKHVDLETWAREIGVLKPSEQIIAP